MYRFAYEIIFTYLWQSELGNEMRKYNHAIRFQFSKVVFIGPLIDAMSELILSFTPSIARTKLLSFFFTSACPFKQARQTF